MSVKSADIFRILPMSKFSRHCNRQVGWAYGVHGAGGDDGGGTTCKVRGLHLSSERLHEFLRILSIVVDVKQTETSVESYSVRILSILLMRMVTQHV